MAIGTPTVVGTATATTSATTLVITLSSGVSIGDRVFVAVSGRGSGQGLLSVVDARSNTWAVDNVHVNTAGNNHVGIASAPVTTALLTSDTVTLTHTATPGPSRQAVVWKVSGLGASPLDKIADGAELDTSLVASGIAGTTAALAQADEIVFSCWVLGAPTPNNRVVGSSYTELQYISSSGAASGDRPLWVQYRIVAATTAVSPGGSWNINDFGGGIVGLVATYKGTADVTAPTVPAGLAISGSLTPTGGGVSWTASTDAVGVTGYKVYRDGVLYRTVTGTFALLTNLTPATSYTITVSAFDLAGNESAQSGGVTVLTFPARRRARTVDPRPLAGVYRGAGQAGMNDVREWERWLGRPVKRALDFIPTDNWGSIESPFNAFWNGAASPFYANGGERITMGLTLVPDSNTGGVTNPGTDPPTLVQAASGIYNAHYSKVADFVAGLGLNNVTFRPGNEFNGVWGLPWQPSTTGALNSEFAEAYRQCVTTMRNRAATISFAQNWKFEFSHATGDNGGLIEMDGPADPGSAYWDILSLNCYDESYSSEDVDARWNRLLTSTPTTGGPGLNYARDFVAAKGKVLAFGEIGPVWHPSATNYAAADSQRFLEYVFDWIADGDNRVSYWNWWDGSATWVYRLLQRDPTVASKVLPHYQRTYHRLVSSKPLGASLRNRFGESRVGVR